MDNTAKKDYLKKLEDQLMEWDAAIRGLEAKAASVAAEAKKEYAQRLEELKRKKDELSVKLKELKGSSDDAWGALKTGIMKAAADLKASVEEARGKFK